MFLWLNISPGYNLVISFGGTLESEHPIIKYLGVYPCESLVKYSGSKANRS